MKIGQKRITCEWKTNPEARMSSSEGGQPSCSSSEDTQIYSVKASCIAFTKVDPFPGFVGIDCPVFLVGISTVCQTHMALIRTEG